ncbi:MAG: tetratricopeptide repeat protein [Anaerolineae bacterium]|jgi:tetratricopeptide (TPR) repeat protein|nr:tetratricopeptide repeat protein [Anaerolineae bacterium]MBT7073072.1 tetratricopeptide repeat protein [Anaerolineae bacterium]MBT7323533.1 tetratricopeptide repeat protein [Anaerolineae bacterium]
MKRPIVYIPATLLLVIFLIIAPSVIMGYQNERNARAALANYEIGNYPAAAINFELAARRLFWRPELWDDVGDVYAMDQLWGGMARAYEEARVRNALTACNWNLLGAYYSIEEDNPGLALRTWEEGLQQYPENFFLAYAISTEYKKRGDYTLELKYLLDSLDGDMLDCNGLPISAAKVHYRISLLLMQDDPTRALEELNTTARLDEEFAPVVETLRTSLNLASLEDDPAEKLILIGRGLALAEEWQLAANAFDNATQVDPENASAWAWLGEAKYQIGEDALPFFEKAASINPNSQTLLSLRALYWQRYGDFETALTDFEKLAVLEPENPNWQISLGALYAVLNDLPAALAAYEKAIELAPTEPTYRELLALFSFDYQYDMAVTGLSAARRAIILAPEEARYIDTLGLVYLGLDRDEDAERQFLRALEKDAEYAAAHLHLGMLYLKRGYPELAYNSLLRARELTSDWRVLGETKRLLDEYFQE